MYGDRERPRGQISEILIFNFFQLFNYISAILRAYISEFCQKEHFLGHWYMVINRHKFS